ncbi:Choline/Carnitine O-acyltransferase [Dictyocaulus viviparus]|uniref:Choline/Carnitine O-acyltransferase n=1 Tax=Dictyocaulus viviparus TaxID=29172 RepID=A0A0D8Y3S3_DICVI|nr:Choline/Carnitine O-acyltransferase [Dictyocaulus viviparus]
MLTGNGVNRWADKSLNYTISANGRFGGTVEHSIGDGPEFDHLMENFVANELLTEIPSLEEQRNIGKLTESDRGLELATRLEFEINSEMAAEIERSYKDYCKLRDDVDVAATVFRKFGKGLIKKFGVSPDAFIQMAIQLANYWDQKRFVLTYESASARFYKNSRTETLRTVSKQSCEFVLSMMNEGVSDDEKIKRLRTACDTGQGIDRHLFVLYVLSQGLCVSSPFLDHFVSQPWLLSTSHIPKVTNQIDEDNEVWKSWLGACFGAVAQHGYGICYRFAGNHSIIAHVTSYKSARNTDSARFRDHLTNAFRKMADLFSTEANVQI